MANGDITKETSCDKIEIVNTWTIQVRQVTKIMEEQSDGSKKEISRTFNRHSLQPCSSVYKTKLDSDKNTVPDLDSNGKYQWTHTDTDLSKEDAKVKKIAEAAWDSDTKTAFKSHIESRKV